MPDRFPLERTFVRDDCGPTILGLAAVGILLRLAFGHRSDEGFAAEQLQWLRQRFP